MNPQWITVAIAALGLSLNATWFVINLKVRAETAELRIQILQAIAESRENAKAELEKWADDRFVQKSACMHRKVNGRAS